MCMPRSKKPGTRSKQISFQLSEDEYLALKNAAVEAGGVSVSHLLRSAGTAVVGDPDLRSEALAAQARRDYGAGAAIPDPTSED